MNHELELVAQILELIQDAGGTSTQAEVGVSAATTALTRFATSYIHQNHVDETVTVALRLHKDGRTASGVGTLTTPEALGTLVARTIEATELAPVDPGWPGLALPAPLPAPGTVDEDIVAVSAGDRADRVRAFVEAAGGLPTAGYCRTRHVQAAFGNSAGQAVLGGTTEVALEGIARAASADGPVDGSARLAGTHLSMVDGAVLGARAASKARAAVDAVELPAGRYEVVLEPTAVQDVLQCLAYYGFNGKLHNERRSFFEPGQPQFDRTVTIVDDAVSPGLVGLPFDSEGTPRRRFELVVNGLSGQPVHDRRTAKQAGGDTVSTGHAALGAGAMGVIAPNLALLPPLDEPASEVDGPAADSAVAALLAGVRQGLLVTDHWYTRVLDPRTLVMTGLTRNGVWLVNDGEITRPVRNFRFTQSYPQALGPDQVLGVGTHLVTLPAPYGGFSYRAPALRLASWNFTGTASG
jgi:predicted Zn-dependent protease